MLIQLTLELLIRYISGSELIIISWNIIFLFNITLFFIIRKKIFFYLLQFISFMLFSAVVLPHNYYFNIFSFIKRINYLLISPEKFIRPALFSILIVLGLYIFFKIQYYLLKQTSRKFYFLPIFVLTLFICELTFKPIEIKKNGISISYIGSNYIPSIISDYKKYQKGNREINNYKCNNEKEERNNNISPTIFYLNNSNEKKDFLIIMESWGEMKKSEDQIKLMEFIKSSFFNYKKLSSSFNLKFGNTCFQGNTSAAEGRELLNMNDEESYGAFLNFGFSPEFNVVKNKIDNNYHTIAGFSASKRYGSNFSNAEGFRNALNFDSKIYFENLKKSYKTNYENNYNAVYDESLIDSIINESKQYEKVFAYALTINTHPPFVLDKDNIKNIENYRKSKYELLNIFDQNENAFDQFYRIFSIIDHLFKKVEEDNSIFDRILVIGDHPNPDFNSRSLYNDNVVPYIYLEKSDNKTLFLKKLN